MLIRPSSKKDQAEIAKLIRGTIESVNASDYSTNEISVWSERISIDRLIKRYDEVIQFVAEENSCIVGIGDINIKDQEIDFLYVHKNYIGTGVGSQLLSRLEDEASHLGIKKLKVTASITAKPFFLSKGFTLIEEAKKPLP